MFITLTNANPAHKGKSITLNTDHIVSVWEGEAVRVQDEEGTATEKQLVTFIFVPPHGTWEVSETPEQVQALLG